MWCYSVIFISFMYVQNPVLFFDDFKDRLHSLNNWRRTDDGVQFLRGKVRLGRNAQHASIKITVPGSENWTNYTLKLKFRMIDWEERSSFDFRVRAHKGRFDILASQLLMIFPNEQQILALTHIPELNEDEPSIQRGKVKQDVSRRKWYLLEINTVNDKFTFSLDGQQLLSFIDLDTPPGSVLLSAFRPTSEVEIDYVQLEIPSQSVTVKEKLTTTWGRIKNSWGQ